MIYISLPSLNNFNRSMSTPSPKMYEVHLLNLIDLTKSLMSLHDTAKNTSSTKSKKGLLRDPEIEIAVLEQSLKTEILNFMKSPLSQVHTVPLNLLPEQTIALRKMHNAALNLQAAENPSNFEAEFKRAVRNCVSVLDPALVGLMENIEDGHTQTQEQDSNSNTDRYLIYTKVVLN